MLQRTLFLAVLLPLLVGGVACVVAPAGPPRAGFRPAGPPACHPSQYWDGYQCRHKGQGRGARKHDGH